MRPSITNIVLTSVCALVMCLNVYYFWPNTGYNVLLISLDTTRADRLGCYGYAAGRTPVLDSIAVNGVLCEHVYAVVPLTLPAHASLFTGLYPRETGVVRNHRRLDDSFPTLAEILASREYDTGAFLGGYILNSKFGLNRGFNTYDDVDHLTEKRSGESVVDAALKWLAKNRYSPFFCWVHLYDPHLPRESHSELFGDEFANRLYDGEIAYADRQIGRLLDFLKHRNLESKTVVVVVADHGESLGDHGEGEHRMTLYNSTMHIPLLFRLPSKLGAGRKIALEISMVDVSPTILGILGITDERRISGKSFSAALVGASVEPSTCYGITDEPFLRYGWSPLQCLIEGGWKYIRTRRPELYDLVNDPRELHNLATENSAKLLDMESRMGAFESKFKAIEGSEVKLTRPEIAALASLGYVAGEKPASVDPSFADLPDIKEMLEYEARFLGASKRVKSKQLADTGIRQLRELILQAPGFRTPYICLADTLIGKGDMEDATSVLRALVKSVPEYGEGHLRLGMVLADRRECDEALAELKIAKAIDPYDDRIEMYEENVRREMSQLFAKP